MSFNNLMASLRLDIKDFAAKLNTASSKAQLFATKLNNNYKSASNALLVHNLGLKDTARIVQGIAISQVFYAAVGAIRDASSALWDFNVALDYAQVAYSALFGSTKVSSDFVSALQEHSIETIFDFQGLTDVSKKLLAYGIDYENLMFIIEGLTNLGTLSGDSAALDRIALALGQIYTKGKLSAEEMRQLANAYIPITEILQEKFGLTGDDLKRVGDLNLPAADVINAIVDYANENFASVGDAAMLTITGLQNKVVDSLKVMGAAMLEPITSAYKSFLAYISDGLEAISSEFNAGGMGGVFEYLVPDPRTQQTIRQFIANVRNSLMSLASVGTVLGQVFSNFATVFVTAFNIVSPILIGLTNILSATLNAILNTQAGAVALRVALVAAAGAFVVLRVQALASLVITTVTNAVINLTKALMLLASLIAKHPILSLLAAVTIGLIGASVASKKANDSISGLFDTMSGAAGGASSGDILQRVNNDLEEGANAADQFGNRLESAAGAANDLADAIGGAGGAADKAAKKTGGLLSFDEVYKLPDQKDSESGGGGGGSGLLGSLEDLVDGFGGIGADLGDALIPEVPDFSDFIGDFTDGLFGGLEDGVIDKLKSAGIGNLIGTALGAIIGAIAGGPGGAKIGMAIGGLAGTIVGWLFAEFEGAISNGGTGAIAGIGAAIARSFGASFSTVVRTLVSTGTIDDFFKSIAGIFSSTGLKSLLKGGILGAIIGLLVDGIAHLLWTTLAEKLPEDANVETAKIGQTIGSLIGTVIGGAFGGPVGMMIGSAIGTFIGGVWGLFWEGWKENMAKVIGAIENLFSSVVSTVTSWADRVTAGWTNTYTAFSTWWEDTKNGFIDWRDNTFSQLTTWWNDTKSGFSDWWDDTKSGLSTWWDETVDTFSDWDSINGDTLSTWWNYTRDGFTDWVENTVGDFIGWRNDTETGFNDWSDYTSDSISDWWDSTVEGFSNWVDDVTYDIRQWASTTKANIDEWWASTKLKLSNWWDDTRSNFSEWAEDTREDIGLWVVNTLLDLAVWSFNATNELSNWWENTKLGFTEWATNAGESLRNWKSESLLVIGGFFIAAHASITEELSSLKEKWDARWDAIRDGYEAWWENLGGSVSGWLNDYVWEPIADFFNINNFWPNLRNLLNQIKAKISGWWSGVSGMFNSDGISVNVSGSVSGAARIGHASGGIFDREHIARFAEGNKAEAIIPLENASAMQPFVDAVSNGIIGAMAPIMAQNNAASNDLPPMYVGTLIADDRGLKQLYNKFRVIQLQENDRKGLGVNA